MSRRLGLAPMLALSAVALGSQVGVEQGRDEVTFTTPSGQLVVHPCTDRIIEVYGYPASQRKFRRSISVIREFTHAPFTVEHRGSETWVRTKDAAVSVENDTGRVTLHDGSGGTLLKEAAGVARLFTRTTVGGQRAWHIRQQFDMPEHEAFYGMGCLQKDFLDFTGHTAELVRDNTVEVNPMIVSTGGYGLLWDNASASKISFGDTSGVIPSGRLFGMNRKTPGLNASFFEGNNFGRKILARIDPKVDFVWKGSPAPGVAATHFSARWEGFVKTGPAGLYNFGVDSDDGARLWVDSKKVVDDWRIKAPSASEGSIALPENTLVPIKLEYFQNEGGAEVKLNWEAPSKGHVMEAWSDVADRIHYYFIAGPEIDEIVKGYRLLTGDAPMFGKWAYGLWQCKERYKTQDEILGIVRQYRTLGIPLDNVVQDWMYWPGPWGSHQFDLNRYPNPTEMIRTLHDDLHAHFMISVWAKFEKGSDNYSELSDDKLLFPDFGDWSGHRRYYDAFNPEGREVYWRQMRDELFKLGVDAWWLDATEPEISRENQREVHTGLGPGGWNENAYSLATTTAVYQGQRKTTDKKRVFILTRSVFSGQQRNAAACWSGDVMGTWDVFRKQVASGLNFCMAGVPYWCTDIGGFFSHPATDPEYRELFIRWFQWGAFCPVFRVHGTGADKELWRFGPEAQRILTRYDDLRYRLLPYIYSTAWKITNDGYTMMRALPMDFRRDPATWKISDQLMFGPSLMICPVEKAGVDQRTVYLPAGSGWFDFWTGEGIPGGRTLEMPAGIDTMPIAVRAGSIVPMGPVVQYAQQQANPPLELRIYPGANGSFTLYDDSGDGYGYETGARSTIRLTWDNVRRQLTIGARQGSYPGMAKSREFRIVVVQPGHGSGIGEVMRPDKVVQYRGSPIIERFARL